MEADDFTLGPVRRDGAEEDGRRGGGGVSGVEARLKPRVRALEGARGAVVS